MKNSRAENTLENGYVVSELHAEDNQIQNMVMYQLYVDYLEQKIDVPGLPEICIRIRDAIKKDSCSATNIARLVQTDPSLALKLIQIANSAAYKGVAPVHNIQDAVVRIGLNATRDIVTQFVLRDTFKTSNRTLKKMMVSLWQYSNNVAVLCFLLSRELGKFIPEQALLAGLLHGIGSAALITRMDDYPEILESGEDLDAMIETLGPEIGSMVLRKWGFAEIFVKVVLESSDPYRTTQTEQADLCDLVLISRFISSSNAKNKDIDITTLPAYSKLGMEKLARLDLFIEKSRHEISEIRKLLV